jgi:hydroxypyruvate reductase
MKRRSPVIRGLLASKQSHRLPQKSLEAAAAIARKAGITPLILGDSIEGEAREVGFVMAGIALQSRRFGQPLPAPCVLISGGETTVTVRGSGAGGRNVEFLLALALKRRGENHGACGGYGWG